MSSLQGEEEQAPYLSDGEERCTKDDVTNRPSVLECPEDKDQLGDDVDDCADEGPEDVDNPKAERVVVFEASELLEGGDRNEESDTPNEKA